MPRTRPPPIRPLAGARFVAAVLIVAFHYITVATPWLDAIYRSGYLGVCFFFVLSGFVLAYNYASDPAEKVGARAFWVARFARIYPLFLLALILDLPFFLRQLRLELPQIGGTLTSDAAVIAFFNLTLTQTFALIRPVVGLFNTPGWAVSVEAFLYLLFPFLARPLARLGAIAALIATLASLLPSPWPAALRFPDCRTTAACWPSGAVSFGTTPRFYGFLLFSPAQPRPGSSSRSATTAAWPAPPDHAWPHSRSCSSPRSQQASPLIWAVFSKPPQSPFLQF
jgi:peptidoglycan/LPS O-acetylase OafA/YrhL